MFKFDFGAQLEVGAPEPQAADPPEQPQADGASPADQAPAEEVLASEGVPTGAQETVVIGPDLTLIKGVVSNAQAAALLGDERVASNDLIPSVYEGGFKTWEGGLDLARFLAARLAEQRAAGEAAEVAPGTRVMELGCGSGLPGLVALWAGAEVHFQDYNRSVLSRLTTQNVAANQAAWATRRQAAAAASGSEAAAAAAAAAAAPAAAAAAGQSGGPSSSSGGGSPPPPPPRYFAGSWDALPGLLEGAGLLGGYDVVLTAETIYSLEAMRSLHACLAACLRPGGGASVAYVAAKSYYFGVGGGTDAFSRLVAAEGRFACTTFAVVDDGLSTRREILRLTPLV